MIVGAAVVLHPKSSHRDGATQFVMQPQGFMQRLAALVPRPPRQLIRFHGAFAAHIGPRAPIIPQAAQKGSAAANEHARLRHEDEWAATARARVGHPIRALRDGAMSYS